MNHIAKMRPEVVADLDAEAVADGGKPIVWSSDVHEWFPRMARRATTTARRGSRSGGRAGASPTCCSSTTTTSKPTWRARCAGSRPSSESMFPSDLWPDVVERCTFEAMKARPDEIGPFEFAFVGGADSFLFKGTNGRWRDVLTHGRARRLRRNVADHSRPTPRSGSSTARSRAASVRSGQAVRMSELPVWMTEGRDAWVGEFTSWITDAVGAPSAVTCVRERIWGAVHRVELADRVMFFKATGPGGRHEPVILADIARTLAGARSERGRRRPRPRVVAHGGPRHADVGHRRRPRTGRDLRADPPALRGDATRVARAPRAVDRRRDARSPRRAAPRAARRTAVRRAVARRAAAGRGRAPRHRRRREKRSRARARNSARRRSPTRSTTATCTVATSSSDAASRASSTGATRRSRIRSRRRS